MGLLNRTTRALLTKTDESAFVVGTSAYTARDVVGGTALCRTGIERGVLIRGVTIRDTHKQDEPYLIRIYRSSPSVIADADPMAPTVADGDLEIGIITVGAGDYVTAPGTAYSKAYVECSLDLDEESAGDFYVNMDCTATPDYNAATDVKVEFSFWPNR